MRLLPAARGVNALGGREAPKATVALSYDVDTRGVIAIGLVEVDVLRGDEPSARGVVALGFAAFGVFRRRHEVRMFGVERRRLPTSLVAESEFTLSFDAESPRMVAVRHSPLTDTL